MDATRWDRIAELYGQASDLQAPSRQEFLRNACAGDDDLFREVDGLLRQEVTQAGSLERVLSHVASEIDRNLMPHTVGGYRLVRLIGHGGMGTVYEAEQAHPRRIVALKVIRRDGMFPDAVRRFGRELEALGRLQHSGIARIYDAGFADTGLGPQPWFAMEYVAGPPLDVYCRNHQLDTTQRLELIVRTAHAVHHAHERGIVHRDLKPANILVEAGGQPKILDFGVARFTNNAAQFTLATEAGNLLGTLAYMSPEQVLAGENPPDARSDVYALGVILYELLAGSRPYCVTGSLQEATRAILETEPRRLGVISREFRGDLEIIAERALQKAPSQRYASALEFASDLERYLASEPILARPPGTAYRVSRFARRHRALVLSVAAIFIVLVIGIAATTRAALRANRAEAAALAERDRASDAGRRAALDRDLALRAREEATGERARAEQERNSALAQSRRADQEAAAALAVNEFLTNDVLFQASTRRQAGPATKPDPDLRVRTALDRAATGLDGKFAGQPAVEAAIRHTIGVAYKDLSLYREAEKHLARARQLWQTMPGTDLKKAIETANELAFVYREQGKFDDAEKLLNRTLALQRRNGSKADRSTLTTMNDLAMVMIARRGDHERGELLISQVLNQFQHNFGDEDPGTLSLLNNLATEYTNEGKYLQAAELYTRALAVKKRVMGPEHPSTLSGLNSLGVVYRNLGRYAKARELLTEALQVRRRVQGNTHLDTLASIASLGRLSLAEGRYEEAETLLKEALDGGRLTMGAQHIFTLAAMDNLAEVYARSANLVRAEAMYRDVVDGRRRVLGAEHPNTANSLASLGGVKFRQGDFVAAEALLREAFDLNEKTGADTWRRYYAQASLGASLSALHRRDEAEALLLAAWGGLSRKRATVPAEYQPLFGEVRGWLSDVYRAAGNTAAATRWRDTP